MPKFIPDSKLAERWGISSMTIWRWERQYPDFPKKRQVNGRNYRAVEAVEDFERAHFATESDGAA